MKRVELGNNISTSTLLVIQSLKVLKILDLFELVPKRKFTD